MSRQYESLLNQEEALEASRISQPVVLSLWDAMGRLDFEKAALKLKELKSIAGTYCSEPARMACEVRYIECAAALAETYLEAERYDISFELAIAAWEDLVVFQERMRSLDLPSKGSQAVAAIVDTIAKLKWLCPDRLEEWPPLSLLHEEFYTAAKRVLDHWNVRQALTEMSEVPPDVLDLLRCAGTSLAKLDYLFKSPELDELLSFLEQSLNLNLSRECLAFKSLGSFAPEDRMYWEFEIAKMIADGTGGLDDFDFCNGYRCRLQFQLIGPSHALERLWARERQHFMRGLELAPVVEGSADEAIARRGDSPGA